LGVRARERVLAEFDVRSNARELLDLIVSSPGRRRDPEDRP
jgi:hypothetical protein